MSKRSGSKGTPATSTTRGATLSPEKLEKMRKKKDLVPLIKSMQSLTRLLGKLGIAKHILARDPNILYLSTFPTGFPQSRPPWPWGISYGLGLKEAKDWTENYLNRKR